jgi:hypothetical protein
MATHKVEIAEFNGLYRDVGHVFVIVIVWSTT